jgi:hypothetical protein
MKHKRLIVIVTAAALLLLAGGIAWAADREPAAAARQQFSVVGDVVSIEGDEVMVQPEGGQEVSVLLGDETHQWLPGEPPTTTLSLAVGDPVLVLGRPARNGAGEAALIARFILIAEREDLPRYVVRGQAVAVTAQTIVVQTGQTERAITVGRATRLWSLQGRLESLREVKAGDRVLAVGQPTELGQWQAGAVLAVGTTATAQPALRGEVTAIDLEAGTLEVETARGPVTVVTGEDTRYRLPGVEDPGLDDIQVGDRIVAVGRPESRDPLVFAARVIGILPAREEQASAPPDA